MDLSYDFNLKTKYLRNTHFPNGKYREEMRDVWKKIPSGFAAVVHLLDPVKPMNLEDIVREGHRWAMDEPSSNPKVETDPYILEDVLELLVNFDMVKEVDGETNV